MESAGGSARSGHVPVDDDNDGLFDEDGPNDLNGNGVIEQIRKYVPGKGTHRISRIDPRILEAVGFRRNRRLHPARPGRDRRRRRRPGQRGRAGSYDQNRNYPSDWQPNYIQSGAMDYPFQLPEARAESEFLVAHPNIAGVQSYHNNGGMILRGPGAEATGEYPHEPTSGSTTSWEKRRTDPAVLPLYRHLERPVHRPWRIHRFHQRRPGHPVLLQRALERRAVFHQPRAEGAAEGSEQPDRPAKDRAISSTTSWNSATSSWSGNRSSIPNTATSRSGAAGRNHQPRPAPVHARGTLPPEHGLHPLPGRRDAQDQDGGGLGGESGRRTSIGCSSDIANPKVTPTILAKAAQNNVVRPDLLTLEGKNARGHLRELDRQQGSLQNPADRDHDSSTRRT